MNWRRVAAKTISKTRKVFRFQFHQNERRLTSPCEFRELKRHCPVHVAPERHHEVGDAVELLPAPAIEFGRLPVARRQWIDLVVTSGVPQREPLLPLTAKFREAMSRRSDIRRKLVGHPVGLAEMFGL